MECKRIRELLRVGSIVEKEAEVGILPVALPKELHHFTGNLLITINSPLTFLTNLHLIHHIDKHRTMELRI
jgi:hypothetical protein